MADEPVLRKPWSGLLSFQTSLDPWDKAQKALAELLEAKERVEGIVTLCSLDDILEQLLRAAMIEDESVDTLMNDGQALQSFNSKLRLAYALGLIPETVRKDLTYLNKIRNEFAHNANTKSFDESPIRDWCGNLSTMKRKDGTILSPRLAYGVAVVQSLDFLAREFSRKIMEKVLHQSQQVDSVESRFATYRGELYKEAK